MEKQLYLTETGASLMGKALVGDTIAITHFSVGCADLDNPPTPQEMQEMTAIVSPVNALREIKITYGVIENGSVHIKGKFSSQDNFETFSWSELGIYASERFQEELRGDGTKTVFRLSRNTYTIYSITPIRTYTFDPIENSITFETAPTDGEVLYVAYPDLTSPKLFAYGYDPDPKLIRHLGSCSAVQVYEIEQSFTVGSSASIDIMVDSSSSWVTQEEFDEHVENRNNPHEVTADQVGLTGSAGTSVVNNMKPSFTRAGSLTNISTGNNMRTIFSRISRFIYYVINTVKAHIDSRSNPHNVSFSDFGGVVPISGGGTGSDDSESTGSYEDFWYNLLSNGVPEGQFGSDNVVFGVYLGNGVRKRKIDLKMTGIGCVVVIPTFGSETISPYYAGHFIYGGLAMGGQNASGNPVGKQCRNYAHYSAGSMDPLPVGSIEFTEWNTDTAILVDYTNGCFYVANDNNKLLTNVSGVRYHFVAIRSNTMKG